MMKCFAIGFLYFWIAGTWAAESPPFTVSVVPAKSLDQARELIEMADKDPGSFFVVLTNISGKDQPIWEMWNSWGYQNVSFAITVGGEKTPHLVSVRPHPFDKNFPSTFTIPPGERFVFHIALDKAWESQPKIPKKDEQPITLKAIYHVADSPQAGKFNVWVGTVESKDYQFKLWQR